jgi:hypothetical protein
MSKRYFRILIICNWLLLFACIAGHLIARRTLPPELRGWLQAYLRDPAQQISTGRAIVDLAVVLLNSAVVIGLFNFKRWAKSALIPATVLLYLPIKPTFISVNVGWVIALYSVQSLSYGMIIALTYFSPVSKEFDGRAIQ